MLQNIGIKVVLLPTYSAELSPIELQFGIPKCYISKSRQFGESLWTTILKSIALISHENVVNSYRHVLEELYRNPVAIPPSFVKIIQDWINSKTIFLWLISSSEQLCQFLLIIPFWFSSHRCSCNYTDTTKTLKHSTPVYSTPELYKLLEQTNEIKPWLFDCLCDWRCCQLSKCWKQWEKG